MQESEGSQTPVSLSAVTLVSEVRLRPGGTLWKFHRYSNRERTSREDKKFLEKRNRAKISSLGKNITKGCLRRIQRLSKTVPGSYNGETWGT